MEAIGDTQNLQPDIQKAPPESKFNPWMVSTIVLLAALIIVGAYSLNLKEKQTVFQPFPQPTAPSTVIPTLASISSASKSTTDWLTYANAQYGYSIKYPHTLFYKIWDTSKDSKRKHHVVFLLKKYKDKNMPQPPEIGLVIYENPEKIPLKDWLDKHTDFQGESIFEKVVDLRQVTIVNAPALRFVEESPLWEITAPTVLISRDTEIFRLFYTNAYSKDDLSKTFNQILSTFKFLE